ncbi:MAG: tRNA guanosine(34) transglycosylase Tgt, partial [Gammaproteobacteria bacterium]
MTSAFGFELMSTSGAARRGRIQTAHGTVETPAFMPVGTYGTVKAMTPEELEQLGADIVLGNTFHLMLRPGGAVIRDHGGLHGFMHWRRPILTDSGGFQVWSLTSRTHVSEEGVEFNAPKDGRKIFLSPEISMDVQCHLGSDIQMVFDECTRYPATIEETQQSMGLSLRWAERCRAAFDELGNSNEGRALFGIVQGGVYPKLRIDSLDGLLEIGFDGIALGGLSVGETREERDAVLEHIAPKMPAEQPRYLMGVGTPVDILDAVCRGIDMFDCVMPTRHGRNGYLFTETGTLRIRNARFRNDLEP